MSASTQQGASISTERMPSELIAALALVKRACATANRELDRLSPDVAQAIDQAAQKIMAGHGDPQFDLTVWQASASALAHHNLSEVLTQLASDNLVRQQGVKRTGVNADAHVNLGQSASDIFATATHVAASVGIAHNLLPALAGLRAELLVKAEFGQGSERAAIVGQELAGHVAQLTHAHEAISRALPPVYELALEGAKPDAFGRKVALALAEALELPFVSTFGKFTALTSLETLVNLHGTLKSTALALMKISNDLRPLTPAADQAAHCDALTMVCCQVLGNDVAMTVSAAMGQLESSTPKPLIAHNLLQSIRLLADATSLFTDHFARDVALTHERSASGLASSLMLVTSRVPQTV